MWIITGTLSLNVEGLLVTQRGTLPGNREQFSTAEHWPRCPHLPSFSDIERYCHSHMPGCYGILDSRISNTLYGHGEWSWKYFEPLIGYGKALNRFVKLKSTFHILLLWERTVLCLQTFTMATHVTKQIFRNNRRASSVPSRWRWHFNKKVFLRKLIHENSVLKMVRIFHLLLQIV